MKTTTKAPAYVPAARTMRVPPDQYQPRKAEKERETDMPGMSDDELRRTFFRPFEFVRDGAE